MSTRLKYMNRTGKYRKTRHSIQIKLQRCSYRNTSRANTEQTHEEK